MSGIRTFRKNSQFTWSDRLRLNLWQSPKDGSKDAVFVLNTVQSLICTHEGLSGVQLDAILEAEIAMSSQDLKHQKIVEDTNRRPFNNTHILDKLYPFPWVWLACVNVMLQVWMT